MLASICSTAAQALELGKNAQHTESTQVALTTHLIEPSIQSSTDHPSDPIPPPFQNAHDSVKPFELHTSSRQAWCG